jgi:FkbM family methyltransferase
MPLTSLKHTIRKLLNRTGWDVGRFDPLRCEAFCLVRQLALHKVEVVLDIGANIGQFAQKLRTAGYTGKIVSFEASSSAHSVLLKKASRDSNWIVAPQVALGDRNGTVMFNIAGNSASSSALPMLASHLKADPKSRYVGTESVTLRTLDVVAQDFLSLSDRVFLKLDVQGSEYAVLQGAERMLERVIGVQCELSLVPLYGGEHLFHPMLHELEHRGFELWSLIPGLVDPGTARLLQLDALFFKADCSRIDDASGRDAGHIIAAVGPA